MFLKQIDISDFRGIHKMGIQLDQTTVLIGENNTGKSTILDALQLALDITFTRDRIRFRDYDHLLAEGDNHAKDGDTIEIIIHFAEQNVNEWSDYIIQKLSKVVQYNDDDDGLQSVILRVRSKYNAPTRESIPEWDFLNSTMQKITINKLTNKKVMQSLIPIFPLKSLRDADKEFRSSSPLWGSFVRSMTMDPDVKQNLENELVNLNQRIVDAHEPFGIVKERLSDIAKLISLINTNTVNVDAFTGNILDVLSQTKISLTSITGSKIPLGRHGEWTRSLAVIYLFVAFFHRNLDDQNSHILSPLLTLEEPEAHLHPSAAHSVIKLLQNPHGQNIIATHSGDLVSNIPLSSLRRLSRKDGKIIISQVDSNMFNDNDIYTLNHHIKTTRGNILFARCWLLVEGKTERSVFEECARICMTDLAYEVVYCIEYAQIGSLQTLIKFAKQLGIEWFVVADGDCAGNSYVAKAKKELAGKDEEAHICQLDHVFEVFLCLEGFGAHYEKVSHAKIQVTSSVDDVDYWKKVVHEMRKNSKIRAALSAVDEMANAGKQCIPNAIHDIIIKSTRLAKEEQ